MRSPDDECPGSECAGEDSGAETRQSRVETKGEKNVWVPRGGYVLNIIPRPFFKKKSIAKSGLLRKSVKRNGLGCQSSKDWPWMQCVLMPAPV